MNEDIQAHLGQAERCPYCGDKQVEGGSIEINGDTALQHVDCTMCGRDWTDVYRLAEMIDGAGQRHHRRRTPPLFDPVEFDQRDVRQRELVPPEKLSVCRATVIGVGAIGRQVAIQLTAMGIASLQLIDPDTVEPANLAPQGFAPDELGRPKVESVGDLCHHLNPRLELVEHAERFRRSMDVGDVVFCCVDSIDTRRHIWQAVQDRVRFFADGRMSAETIRVLAAADDPSRQHYPTTLFTASEAHAGSCTGRSTIYTASIAAGLMLQQFTRWLRGLPIDADLQLNLLTSEISVGSVG